MATDLDSIKNTLIGISKGDSMLDMLLELERTLDDTELFSYKNWILGELVEGPEVTRYWFKVTFMYPYELMPDPDGGLRLTKLGAKIGYRKGTFKKPIKVEGPQDWTDPTSKRAKIVDHPVWLVSIDLPIKYINRGLENIEGIILKDLEDANAEIADAFDNDVESEDNFDTGMDNTESGFDDQGFATDEELGGGL